MGWMEAPEGGFYERFYSYFNPQAIIRSIFFPAYKHKKRQEKIPVFAMVGTLGLEPKTSSM